MSNPEKPAASVPGDTSDRPTRALHFSGAVNRVAERLSLFLESPHNLRSHLLEHAGITLTEQQAYETCSCLHQSREFFRIARTADLAVRPIVTYYGMNSMAKALAVSTGRLSSLGDLEPSHGLSAPTKLGQRLGDSIVLVTRKGNSPFHHLVDTLSCATLIRIPVRGGGTLPIRCPTTTSEDTGGLRATLRELLSRIPSLWNFFAATFGEEPLVTRAVYRAAQWAPDTYQVVLLLQDISADDAGRDQAYRLHRRLKEWRPWYGGGACLMFENLSPSLEDRPGDQDGQLRHLVDIAEIAIPLDAGPDGELFLVGDLQGANLPWPVLLYMAAFLLSSFARYRPDSWAGVAALDRTEADAGMRAVLEDFYQLALDRFPIVVLSAIAHVPLVVWDKDERIVYDWRGPTR